mmetsp:Transcript_16113/g.21296  ORF Transcript_16113/g.21296 Transcript_16113/m.21296 type:complete len:487 (+) Transcript_16113:40-1500(+)
MFFMVKTSRPEQFVMTINQNISRSFLKNIFFVVLVLVSRQGFSLSQDIVETNSLSIYEENIRIPFSVLDFDGSASVGNDQILHLIDSSSNDFGAVSLDTGIVHALGLGYPRFSSSFRLFMQGGLSSCSSSKFTWHLGNEKDFGDGQGAKKMGLSINFTPVGENAGVSVDLRYPDGKFICMDMGIGTEIFYGKWVNIDVALLPDEVDCRKRLQFKVDGKTFLNTVLEMEEDALPLDSKLSLISSRNECENSVLVQCLDVLVSSDKDFYHNYRSGDFDWVDFKAKEEKLSLSHSIAYQISMAESIPQSNTFESNVSQDPEDSTLSSQRAREVVGFDNKPNVNILKSESGEFVLKISPESVADKKFQGGSSSLQNFVQVSSTSVQNSAGTQPIESTDLNTNEAFDEMVDEGARQQESEELQHVANFLGAPMKLHKNTLEKEENIKRVLFTVLPITFGVVLVGIFYVHRRRSKYSEYKTIKTPEAEFIDL